MNKIEKAFENKKAFISFLTAGDPSLDKTEEYIIEMAKAGASLIEIGIPFSDPIAEGPVIQEANLRALSGPNGCTVDMVFDMVASVSQKVDVPLVFLTYLNPVFSYGYERFCKRCQETGISGLIIPDLPYEEKKELEEIADQYEISLIALVAPTSEARVKMIAKEAKGYIYVVSSMGVTGVREQIVTDISGIVEAIREVTDTKIAVGFGINTPEQAKALSAQADGVIVGSAIVKLIAAHKDQAGAAISQYVKEMVSAIDEI